MVKQHGIMYKKDINNDLIKNRFRVDLGSNYGYCHPSAIAELEFNEYRDEHGTIDIRLFSCHNEHPTAIATDDDKLYIADPDIEPKYSPAEVKHLREFIARLYNGKSTAHLTNDQLFAEYPKINRNEY